MELDDLKGLWQALDKKLDRQYAIELQRLRLQKLSKVRWHFRILTIGRVIQLLAGVGLNTAMVQFLIDHLGEPHLVVDAVLLLGFGILMMISSIREFQLIGGIDLAAPVLAIQKRLIGLRRWHLTEAWVFGVTGCVMWVPLTLVAFESLFGADVYLNAPQVVVSFVASSMICLAVLIGAWVWIKRSGRLDRFFAGRCVLMAEEAIGEIARFELDR